MKRPRPQFPRIALEISAWRALDHCAPGAMALAVPGFHSSMPFQEPPECPSRHAGATPHSTFSTPDPHAMGLPGWGQHPPRPQPVEYQIALRFTNISAAPFRFEKVLVEILSSTGFGRGFSCTVTQGGKESPKTQLIRPGGTWEHVVGTCGYTENLVRESGGRPLRLGLAMLLRDREVEAWHTRLPALADLPRFDRDYFSPKVKIPRGARRLHVPSLSDN